ncbi:MAG: antitoxin [Omnitrophica WOR_2 bacterium RIFCSPHIGHO2_02_FULL_50_17]|nr:MAG: antitoxin [Omnitrophica WOR_2 bacterium RIFCSPHIGHO2_02_FULL_50_17]
MKLTKEEHELVHSIERGEWRATTSKAELRKYQQAARQMIKKDARLNIRISSHDLTNLQKRAMEEGLPYQTFVSSLLHKYVTGRLVEAQ